MHFMITQMAINAIGGIGFIVVICGLGALADRIGGNK